jgi:pimeloyl-ACP methyl ester carboxylesterase
VLNLKGWPVTPATTVVVADGGAVSYRQLPGPEGAPAVLLLHGLGATAGLQYTPLLRQLSEHYRVLAVDMRRPRTSTDGSRLFAGVAADAVAALDDAGIDQAVVLGYSIGGLVARVLAGNHPERVRGLVLAATFDAPQPGPWRRPVDLVARAAGLLPAVPLPGAGNSTRLPTWLLGEVGKLSPRLMLDAARDALCEPLPALADLAVPTAFIVTTQDQVISPEQQRTLAGTLPGAPVLEVAAGHAASGLQPELFGPVALDACQRVLALSPALRA